MNKKFKTVTVNRDTLEIAEKWLVDFNKRMGWNYLRSLSHFIEVSLVEYMEYHNKILPKEALKLTSKSKH